MTSLIDIPCDDTDNNKFIQHMLNMQHDIDYIKTSTCTKEDMIELLSPILGMLAQMKRNVTTLSRMEKERRKGNRAHRPRAHKQSSTKNKTLSPSEVSRLVHLPAALKDNIVEIVDNLTIYNTNLADQLIENECLSEDESSHIKSLPTEKDQVRLLVRKIKARGPETIQTFLDVIHSDKPELVRRVQDSLKKIQEQNKQSPLCPICLMTTSVNLKDIADHLWKANIINDELYGEIIDIESLYKHKQFVWSFIRTSINTSEDPIHAKNILIGALEPKYSYISEHLRTLPESHKLPSCKCCVPKRTPLQNIYGDSQTDISSLSGVVPRFEKIYDFTDTESVVSSQDNLGSSLSFDSFDINKLSKTHDQIPGKLVQSEIVTSHEADRQNTISDNHNRSRHTSGPFDTHQLLSKFQLDTDNNNETTVENKEQAILYFPQDASLFSIVRQQSNITVCPAQSTTSDMSINNLTNVENSSNQQRMSISTDSGTSPIYNRMALEFGDANSIRQGMIEINQTPFEESPFATETPSDKTAIDTHRSTQPESYSENAQVKKEDLKPKLRQSRRLLSQLESKVNEDEECDYAENIRQRKVRKSYRRKFIERQKSAPSGFMLTEPRKLADMESFNIGTRVTETRKSKQSRKRENRRERAMSLTDSVQSKTQDVPKTPNIPFNPSWGKTPQRRRTPKWDYHQGRRLRLMIARITASDSELKTDSDTASYSDTFTL